MPYQSQICCAADLYFLQINPKKGITVIKPHVQKTKFCYKTFNFEVEGNTTCIYGQTIKNHNQSPVFGPAVFHFEV